MNSQLIKLNPSITYSLQDHEPLCHQDPTLRHYHQPLPTDDPFCWSHISANRGNIKTLKKKKKGWTLPSNFYCPEKMLLRRIVPNLINYEQNI